MTHLTIIHRAVFLWASVATLYIGGVAPFAQQPIAARIGPGPERTRLALQNLTKALDPSGYPRSLMVNWCTQGTHRFYREGDLMYFELHGLFQLSDAQFMHAEGESIAREHGYVLAVFEGQEGLGMTPEARRYTSMKSRERPIKGATAVIGASLPLRVMTQLLMNVLRLTGRTGPPIHFCATRADAMAWLETQRQALRAQKQAGKPP